MSAKIHVVRLSILSNISLIIMKVGAGIMSGSVSILSEAIHSSMDLMASMVAYYSVKVSDLPADDEHPYGHGKFENVSGVIEALLIIVAAVWIIVEAAQKIFKDMEIQSLEISIGVMLISSLMNYYVSGRLYRVAKETGSVAIEADALHLRTDVYTSAGVAAGLALIWLTGKRIFDPIAAILVALYILKEAYILLRKAFLPLLDISWDPQEISRLEGIIAESGVKFHGLKTRRSGNYRFVEFHIEMPQKMPLAEVHEICDKLEAAVGREFDQTDVSIHPEPTS
ncbi:MAG: cation diffusion facilitator family transporter [Desulfocapsaceae bacterium]|nr:cation diffusion facilitator family transporter [Desulfocapsaceae bacterium]